jgi:c-di-GMP-related signal transduction protein
LVDVAPMERLRNQLDYAKIDFLNLDHEGRKTVCQAAMNWGIPIIAEKVESYEDFQEAKQLGARYFQGYFFAKPNVLRAENLKGSRSHHYEILAEVCSADMNFARLENLLRQDLSLSWLFFRYLNSAQLSWSTEIRSLRHAFSLLGAESLRKWVLLAVIPCMASSKPHELVVESLLRARFCELLTESTNPHSRASELFLVGLLSMLDAIMDAPLSQVVHELNLPPDVRQVLMGEPEANPLMSSITQLAREYMALDAATLGRRCEELGFDLHFVAKTYMEADLFARRVFQLFA